MVRKQQGSRWCARQRAAGWGGGGADQKLGSALQRRILIPATPPRTRPARKSVMTRTPPANDIPLCTALQNLGGPRVPLPWPRHMIPGCRRDRIRSFTFSLRRLLLYSLNLRARRSARARRARDLCGRLRAAERNGGRRRGAGMNPAPKGINEHGTATPGAIFYPSSRGPVSHNERSSAVRSEHHQRVHFRDPRERPISPPGLQPRAEKIDERHVVRLCEFLPIWRVVRTAVERIRLAIVCFCFPETRDTNRLK